MVYKSINNNVLKWHFGKLALNNHRSELMRKKIGSTSKDLAILVILLLVLLILLVLGLDFGVGIRKNDNIYIFEY